MQTNFIGSIVGSTILSRSWDENPTKRKVNHRMFFCPAKGGVGIRHRNIHCYGSRSHGTTSGRRWYNRNNEWFVGACGSANKFPFIPLLLLRSWDVNLGQLVESSYDVLRNRKLLVILNQLKVRFPQLWCRCYLFDGLDHGGYMSYFIPHWWAKAFI